MKNPPFVPADILVPSSLEMEAWSVVACDQFTSERSYWDRVAQRAAGKLSTYHMIFPEAYLQDKPPMDAVRDCNGAMASCLAAGVFNKLPRSFVYVERETSCGVRRGLVGALDLEQYDYLPHNSSPVRASECTVAERLPARMLIREHAPLELPHVMVLIDDEERTVIEPISRRRDRLRKLYDFELMEGGGHIRGWHLPEDRAGDVIAAIEAMSQRELQMVVGDGNHSLAAAKELWHKIKQGLSPEDAERHPARFALVELNNVYDHAIRFEPIHRVVFDTDPGKLLEVLKEKLCIPGGREIDAVVAGRVTERLTVRGRSFGGMLDQLQCFLEEYAAETGGSVDYIHDSDAVMRLTEEEGSIGFLMPAMGKEELFRTVASDGVFPKKSFSIGHARDKRYYLECRELRP